MFCIGSACQLGWLGDADDLEYDKHTCVDYAFGHTIFVICTFKVLEAKDSHPGATECHHSPVTSPSTHDYRVQRFLQRWDLLALRRSRSEHSQTIPNHAELILSVRRMSIK
jgi:hypothetical protein